MSRTIREIPGARRAPGRRPHRFVLLNLPIAVLVLSGPARAENPADDTSVRTYAGVVVSGLGAASLLGPVIFTIGEWWQQADDDTARPKDRYERDKRVNMRTFWVASGSVAIGLGTLGAGLSGLGYVDDCGTNCSIAFGIGAVATALGIVEVVLGSQIEEPPAAGPKQATLQIMPWIYTQSAPRVGADFAWRF